MSEETIRALAGDVRERIRKALPPVVRADQVESLTEILFTTLVNGGGPLGDPLRGWVKLVSKAFYLGNWLATHNPNDPAPSGSGDQITDRIVGAVRETYTSARGPVANLFGVVRSPTGHVVSTIDDRPVVWTEAQAINFVAHVIAAVPESLGTVRELVDDIEF